MGVGVCGEMEGGVGVGVGCEAAYINQCTTSQV